MVPPDAPARPAGPEDYPFDPTARVEQLGGLERLRGIADRKLAAHLFTLYVLADRNSSEKGTQRTAPATSVESLRRLAARALGGELGADGRELAEYFLLDDAGCERVDEDSLRAFAGTMHRLRHGTGQ